ncbi:MAG: DUF302 domain-containing protein [Gammaproteobacteria bacterium]
MPKFILVCSFLFQIFGCAHPNGEYVSYYQVETLKPYDDVLTELELAISENNFRITGHSRVGKVIRERGAKDFPEFDTIQFCNLTHAQTILSIAPEAIRHMPCNVVLYQHQGRTVVRTHLLPTDTDNSELNRFSARMNRILKNMVDFAAEE